MRLLLDMNISPGWVSHLGAAGFEVTHWSSVGPGGAPDTQVMAWARDHDQVLVTHDLDFGAMLAASREAKPSVVQLRTDDLAAAGLVPLLTQALHRLEADLAAGALVTIDAQRVRLRILPLRDRSP